MNGQPWSSRKDLSRQRLALYARYAEVVQAQETALENEDLERFETLSAELDEIRRSVGEGAVDMHGSEGGGAEPTRAFVQEAARILRRTLWASERVQGRLLSMRRRARQEIRDIGGRRSHAHQYNVATGTDPSTHRVNLRF